MNIDSALLIDEIIGGGDGLAYKARRNNADRRPSISEKISNGFRKMLGIKLKEPEVVDPNAPPPILTREQQDMVDMDNFYSIYNHELPDQKPMSLPVKVKKSKERKSVAPDSKRSEKCVVDRNTNSAVKENDMASVHNQSSMQSSSLNSLAVDTGPKVLVESRLEQIDEGPIHIHSDLSSPVAIDSPSPIEIIVIAPSPIEDENAALPAASESIQEIPVTNVLVDEKVAGIVHDEVNDDNNDDELVGDEAESETADEKSIEAGLELDDDAESDEEGEVVEKLDIEIDEDAEYDQNEDSEIAEEKPVEATPVGASAVDRTTLYMPRSSINSKSVSTEPLSIAPSLSTSAMDLRPVT